MALDVAPTSRRHLLAALALVASSAAALPGASAAAAAVADGRGVPPVVVLVGSTSPAHWMPWDRRRPQTARLSSALAAPVSSGPTATNLAAAHAASYTFMAQTLPGVPIRWDPCTTVHWVFNPAGAPAGGLTAVQRAIARIGQASGLHFAYDGTSTAVPTGAYVQSQTGATGFQPLLVGWSTPAASSLLANQPANLVGMDQTIWAQPANGATHIVSGAVALNANVPAPTSGASSWYTFALHELGHAVGLGHTTDTTQIMAPMIPSNATDYGSGDLAGLAKVGGGC